MTPAVVEKLWLHLNAILTAYSEKLAVLDPALIRNIERTENAAFLARGYLAFKRRSDGEEVAITIDIQCDDRRMIVESDVCTDDGDVIATGPAVTIPLAESQSRMEGALNSWLNEFETFLMANESALIKALSKLS